jgi:hypothetical protein
MANSVRWTAKEYQDFMSGKGNKPAAKTVTAKENYQALGRKKGGGMNKTERMYSELLELQYRSGDIQWYKFEAMKFKIAPQCWFKVDFMVLTKEGELQAHEVKAYVITDDSLVKIKACAAMFPFKFFIKRLVKGNWETREF